MHTYRSTRTLVMSESRLRQKRSTVRLSAVVTTLADSQRGMQTSGRSGDSRAGIFFEVQTWIEPTTPDSRVNDGIFFRQQNSLQRFFATFVAFSPGTNSTVSFSP